MEGFVMSNGDLTVILIILIIVGGCVGDNAVSAYERVETMRIEKM